MASELLRPLFLPMTVLLLLCSLPRADLGSLALQLWHIPLPQCPFCINKAWQPLNLGLLCTQRVTAHLHWGKQTSKSDVFIFNHILFLPETSRKMTGQTQSSDYQLETRQAQGVVTTGKIKLHLRALTCLFIVRILICRSHKALGPYF